MTRLIAAMIVVIVLACGAILFLLENPTRFKSQIAQLTQEATGYQVDINGDLSWRYWPPIAIRAEQLTLSASDGRLAEFDSIEADVDLIPLLTGQRALNVERIALSGGSIIVRIDDQGNGNWTPPTSTRPASGSQQSETDETLIPSLQELDIRDVRVTYDNQQTTEQYTGTLTNLHTGAIKANSPFDTSASFTLRDEIARTQIAINTSGRLWINETGTQAGFDQLVTTITATLAGKVWPKTTLTSEGEWRADGNILSLRQFMLQTQHLQAAFSGLVNLAGEVPRAIGTLHLESAAPDEFFDLLEVEVPISSLLLDTDIAATPASLSFKAFEGQFDDSRIKGGLDYRAGETPMIRAELRIDQLNLDETATPVAASSETHTAGADPIESELIPVEALQNLDVLIITRIGQLTLQGYNLSQVKAELKSHDSLLEVIANATAFDGKMVASTSTTLDQPVTTDVQISMDQLDVTQLAQWESLSGKLTGNSSFRLTGTRSSEMQSSVTGKTLFNIEAGELDVRAIKNLAQTIDTIFGKRSAVSDWPDRMPFDNMHGQHLINQGLASGQVLTAEVDNLSIAALGGFNLTTETMAWDVTALLEQTETGTFKVSKQLSGIRWPMTCEGSMNAAPATLCFGHEGAISGLIADILKQDAKRRGTEKIDALIDDKVPEQFRDLTRDLLNDIFKKP